MNSGRKALTSSHVGVFCCGGVVVGCRLGVVFECSGCYGVCMFGFGRVLDAPPDAMGKWWSGWMDKCGPHSVAA